MNFEFNQNFNLNNKDKYPLPKDLGQYIFFSKEHNIGFENLKNLEYAKKLEEFQINKWHILNKDWYIVSDKPTTARIEQKPNLTLVETEVDFFIQFISTIYLQDATVRNRFSTELKMQLQNNDIYIQRMRRIERQRNIRNAKPFEVSIGEILACIENDQFKSLIGNAIVRAQLADQYNIDFKKKKRSRFEKEGIQFLDNSAADGLIGDDPLSVALLNELFNPNIVVITSRGSEENGKKVKTIQKRIDQVQEAFSNGEVFLTKLLEYADKPVASKEAIQAKGGHKVQHQVGSYSLMKKIDHAYDARPPFKSNFPLEAIANSLSLPSVIMLRKSSTNQLTPAECELMQQILQVQAKLFIADIVSTGKTIIIRKGNAEIINQHGQGLRFYIRKPEDTNAQTGIIGFIDTMSVMDRKKAS